MNADLILTLIFGVAYPIITIAVWAIGAFSVGADRDQIKADCWRDYHYQGTRDVQFWYGARTGERVAVAILAGIFWPVAIPIWIGWRKGTFVADALTARDKTTATYEGKP